MRDLKITANIFAESIEFDIRHMTTPKLTPKLCQANATPLPISQALTRTQTRKQARHESQAKCHDIMQARHEVWRRSRR